MIKRAISSAKKHGIDMCHGTPNSANGNCAIESVMFNVNDRQCFLESLPFSPDYYRRIWMTDFKNRTVNDLTWNIYSKEQWEEGWAEMMKSGVYERGLFGDLMLFAIACGVKKVFLIINTHLESPHDPIYVCDPRKFGVEPNTSIPVVVAYNMSHYESLHPLTPADIEKTKELVNQYQSGTYTFSKDDLPFLLNSDMERAAETDEDFVSVTEDRQNGAEVFQNHLPENLRGKRPKEMTQEEKRLYNNIRRKVSRLNESHDHSSARKAKEAEKKARCRGNENEDEKQHRKEADAKAHAGKHAKETAKQRKEKNSAKAAYDAEKKKKETPAEKKQRNSGMAKSNANKRAKETEEEARKRKDKDKQQRAIQRAKKILANMMRGMPRKC